jgi:hypothetical protein
LFFFEILIGAKSKDPDTISSAMPLRGVRTMLLTEHLSAKSSRSRRAERIKKQQIMKETTLVALAFTNEL